MVKFSAPEDRAVKAVLIHKNQKIALKMLYAFLILLVSIGAYCLINIPRNSIKSAEQLFSDNILTGLIVFCAFALFMVVYFINIPINKIMIRENGGYKVVFEQDKIKVLFPDEPEILVDIKDIDAVEEYDIFYLIHCYKYTDEIVCSKSAFEEGDYNALWKYFKDRGFRIEDKSDTKIYVSLINKISQRARAGYSSIIYSAICLALAFPLFWFAIKVLILYVPNLLSLLMHTLYGLKLFVKILLGLIFLPIALVVTIISGITALGIILVPPSLIYLSGYKAQKQLKTNKKALGIVALSFCIIVATYVVLALLVVLGTLLI